MYDQLRREQPNFTEKVQAISGDMLEPALGISEQNKQLLEEKINIVFHSAATIRFDEPLRYDMWARP